VNRRAVQRIKFLLERDNMVKKITESVYVIEHEEAANNVIIIGKKGVVLVDTSLFPEKAKSIAKFIRDLTKTCRACIQYALSS